MSVHVIQAPAKRARHIALALSVVAVMFSFGFGVFLRKWLATFAFASGDVLSSLESGWLMLALVFLLIAMLLRIGASICELLWLERTWANLPVELRKVGPIENVTPVHIFGIAFIPVVAWFWKLGLVASVSNGLEAVRKVTHFKAPVPKNLGITAVMLGWFPGPNIYVAPFLWEMFARRIDAVCLELAASSTSRS